MIQLPKPPARPRPTTPVQRTRATWRAELRRRNAEFARVNVAAALKLRGAF